MNDDKLDFIEFEEKLRRSNSTHKLTLELIDEAREHDCVDFVRSLEIALEYAKMRMNYYIK